MTHEKATPTFCIHVQHSWIYSVTQAACGTLSSDDCIISWHNLIQSRYMHSEAWTKQHPNLLSVFIGVCMHDSGLSFSLLHVSLLLSFIRFPSWCIACVFLYSQWLHPSSFLMSPPLFNPLFSTLLSPFLISLLLFDVSTVFIHLFSHLPSSVDWYSEAAHANENVSDS